MSGVPGELLGSADGSPFSLAERVRFGDLDAMGHLNNVERLRYFETARIAWFQAVLPEHSPTHREEFGFILAEQRVAYRSPAFFEEELRIFIEPEGLGRSSLRLAFRMVCQSDGRLVAEGGGVLVAYDYAGGRARPITGAVRERLIGAGATSSD